MPGDKNQQQETSAQRAFADVARARYTDFRTRWAPLQRDNEARILKDGADGSFARRRAAGMVSTDNAAKFGSASATAVERAAAAGKLGTAGQKLGITGMGEDQATSTGLGLVAADQAGDDAMLTNIKGAVALGSGQAADSVDGMAAVARTSARQAQADAQESLNNRAVVGELAGTGIGIGADYYLNNRKPPVGPGSNPNGYDGTRNNLSAYVP